MINVFLFQVLEKVFYNSIVIRRSFSRKRLTDIKVISYSEVYDEYIITFLLSKSTENMNQNKLVNKETPIQNFMTVSVNKKTKECVVLEDKFLD